MGSWKHSWSDFQSNSSHKNPFLSGSNSCLNFEAYNLHQTTSKGSHPLPLLLATPGPGGIFALFLWKIIYQSRSRARSRSNQDSWTELSSFCCLLKMMTFRSLDEFWSFYVTQHSKPTTRRWHFVGTLASMLLLLNSLVFNLWFVFLVPFVGYGCAWYSHFFVEGNVPATFGHPVWSFLCDFKMFGLMLTGQMDREIKRLEKRPVLQGFWSCSKHFSVLPIMHGKSHSFTLGDFLRFYHFLETLQNKLISFFCV